MVLMLAGGRYMITLMGMFAVYAGFLYNDFFSLGVDIFGSRYIESSRVGSTINVGYTNVVYILNIFNMLYILYILYMLCILYISYICIYIHIYGAIFFYFPFIHLLIFFIFLLLF